jgi:transcriptional regulator with XRE-family HTH domain
MLGVTQHQLGARDGVEVQQIQEYETGADQIGASQMWNVASALEVPVAFFYEGIGGQVPDTSEARAEILSDEKTLGLVRANYTIAAKVPTQRRTSRARPEDHNYSGHLQAHLQAVNETGPVPPSENRISAQSREHAQTFAKYRSHLGSAVMAPLFAALSR